MTAKKPASAVASPKKAAAPRAAKPAVKKEDLMIDRDEAPELDEHFFEHAEVSSGDTVIREASDTMRRRGRPPQGAASKVQQSLRLSREVLDWFRATGDGWQARIDGLLLGYVEAQKAASRMGVKLVPPGIFAGQEIFVGDASKQNELIEGVASALRGLGVLPALENGEPPKAASRRGERKHA